MRSASPLTSALGTSSSATFSSASITFDLLRASTRNLTSRSRFFFTSARSPSTVASAIPRLFANASLTSGRCCASIFFSVHQEIGLLAGDVLALIVSGELQREGLRVAGLHASHRGIELLEHLAFADQELERLGLATVERFAIDLAFEVDRHAVADRGRLGGGALRESAALLAQDVDSLVDRLFGHRGRDALDLGRAEIAELHIGVDLEGRVETPSGLPGRLPSRRSSARRPTRSLASLTASLNTCPTLSFMTS